MEQGAEGSGEHPGVTQPTPSGGDWGSTGSDRGSGTAFDKYQREERVKEMFRGTRTGPGDREPGGDPPSAE